MVETKARPLPEPLEGDVIDLSGGPISQPDLILGMAIGVAGTFCMIVLLYVLSEVCCRCG